MDNSLFPISEIDQATIVTQTLVEPLEVLVHPKEEEGSPMKEDHLPTAGDEIQERFFRVLQKKSLQTSDERQEWIYRRGKFLELWRNSEGKFVKKPRNSFNK